MVTCTKNVKHMSHNVITTFISAMCHTIALFFCGNLLKLSHYAIWFEYNIMVKFGNNPHFNIPLLKTGRILLNSVADLVNVGDYELYLILDFNIFRYDYISLLLISVILQEVFLFRYNNFNCEIFTLGYMNLNASIAIKSLNVLRN